MKGKKLNTEAVICGGLSILAFLLLWQFAVSFTSVGLLIPGPVTTFKDFFESFVIPIGQHTILFHIGVSLLRVLAGYVLAAALGICIGLVMGWFKILEAVLKPVIEVLRPIPAIAWIPISIVWLGLGEESKLFIMFLSAFMVIVMTTYDGARRVDDVLVGASRMLGASNFQVFKTIVFPASVPQIFTGLQNALSVAWMTVLAAEMVRSSEGVGWIIVMGMDNGNTAQILVGMVGISLMGFVLAAAMRKIERKLCAWNIRGI